MASDTDRLTMLIAANTKSYESAMRRIEQKTDKAIKAAQGSVQGLDRQMKQTASSAATLQKALSLGRTFAGGLLAGAGVASVAGLAGAIREVTSSLAQMSAEARRAGVGVEAFQALGYAAAQYKVSTDALTDGLKEMSLRADEFVQTGKGSAADAFARLGYGAEDLARKLQRPDELFLEIIGRMEQLDQAAQIRVADELFGGTGGEQFVQMLGRGEQGIRNLMKQAQDAGVVIDEQLVKKAEEFDRRWNNAVASVGARFKSTMLEMITAADDFVVSVGSSLKQTNNEVAGLEGAIEGLRQRIAAAENSPLRHLIDNAAIEKDRQDLAALEAQLDRVLLKGNASNAALRRQAEDQSMAALGALRATPALPSAPPPGGGGSTGGGTGGAKSRAEPYDLLTDAANRANDSVTRLSDQEQIAFDRAQMIGRTASDALSAIFVHGEKASDVLRGLAQRFAEAAIEAVVLQAASAFLGALGGGAAAPFQASGGMGTSFYGTGSIFHNGGVVGSGGTKRLVPAGIFDHAPRMHQGGIAGLKPNEVPSILEKGELVIPRNALPSGGAATGGANINVSISLAGANGDEAVKRIAYDATAQGMQAALREVPNLAVQAVGEAMRRRPGVFR